ncbi:MAG: HAD hydrolase-like protein, partial [Atopobiaceae bacterium]|nr:HAD hydrolase-like protein [Atopobiaceae bacterium]
ETVSGKLEGEGQPPLALDDCVMVGDRFYDVEAAEAVGIPCIGVTWGGTCEREELETAGAAIIVDTPEQLVRAIL